MKAIHQEPVEHHAQTAGRVTITERLATGCDYRGYFKKAWRKLLCDPGDPAPREVRSGDGPATTVCTNTRQEIEREGGRLVRGWKIQIISAPESAMHNSWRAVAHAVVERCGKYTCVTSEPGGDRFLFLPSTRVAATLSNSEFLSGDYVLRAVLGGHPAYVAHAVGVMSDALASTPEAALPRRMPCCLLPIGFLVWAEAVHPDLCVVELAERMGLPVGTVDDNLPRDDTLFEECCMLDRLSNSPEEAVARISFALDERFETILRAEAEKISQ